MNALQLIFQALPYLAPEVVKAISALAQAPAMSKEELLAAAEDLDNQALEAIKNALGE